MISRLEPENFKSVPETQVLKNSYALFLFGIVNCNPCKLLLASLNDESFKHFGLTVDFVQIRRKRDFDFINLHPVEFPTLILFKGAKLVAGWSGYSPSITPSDLRVMIDKKIQDKPQ